MRRNMIAIVGAAGAIPAAVRQQTEALAEALADANFDLVTGGMDGVMRAVSRGRGRSGNDVDLVHIESGEGRAWQRNPHPASVVRTNLGAMRNHLVVRSADLVVAVSGGAGTLSELAIAWQEGKPIAALRGVDGWSDQLAGTALDHRRRPPIHGCESVEDVVAWAEQQRPEGVFGGRRNQGFYPRAVPALHRVHDGVPSPAQRIHLRFGMSIEKSELLRQLVALNDEVRSWNRRRQADTVALATFDDGWKDVLCLADAFQRLPALCPVLFVGENHFQTPARPLPLQRLYEHCAVEGIDPEDEQALGTATRTRLKTLPEAAQHALLDARGIAPMLAPDWLLTAQDIADLQAAGWVIATHGHMHENLSARSDLAPELAALADAVEERGQMPWLAWPEGQWSAASYQAARDAGIRLQFALPRSGNPAVRDGVVLREAWNDG